MSLPVQGAACKPPLQSRWAVNAEFHKSAGEPPTLLLLRAHAMRPYTLPEAGWKPALPSVWLTLR